LTDVINETPTNLEKKPHLITF